MTCKNKTNQTKGVCSEVFRVADVSYGCTKSLMYLAFFKLAWQSSELGHSDFPRARGCTAVDAVSCEPKYAGPVAPDRVGTKQWLSINLLSNTPE